MGSQARGWGCRRQQHGHRGVHIPGTPAPRSSLLRQSPQAGVSGGGVRSAILSAALGTGSLALALAGVVTALLEHSLVEKMPWWGVHPGSS